MLCRQRYGRDAARRADPSAAAETSWQSRRVMKYWVYRLFVDTVHTNALFPPFRTR